MRALALAVVLLVPACTSDPPASDEALIVVSAPLTSQPWIGDFVRRGAELAAEEVSADGGRRYRVEVLDNAGSPQQAVANARQAVADKAVALITDGVGAVAVSDVTDPASLPVFVVFEGGASIIDPEQRPTLFRLAPANRFLATRLGDYLSERAKVAALLSDDSSYGREGAAATRVGLARNEIRLATDATLSTGDAAPQVLAARRAGAKALVVWARAAGVAAVVRAARSAGWDVPVFSGPTAADPLVRQRLADHPEWVEGLTFVSFRITSEVGPEPFAAYRAAYEKAYGVEDIGVTAGGRPVLQPPDWSTYSYDAVRLLDAALATGKPAIEGLESTVITGANGDERGYGPTDREGVAPDDMYFARFEGMRFVPVKDDILSTNLPTVPQ